MILDKLKYGAINNKKIISFLLGLGILGIIFGSLFIFFVSNTDQNITINYISDYISNLTSNNYLECLKSTLTINLSFIVIVWLLGISIIGLPIIIFLYFYKSFSLGFTLSSFILTYKLKGLFYSIFYVLPVQIFIYVLFVLVTLYGIKMSFNLIYSIFKKKDVNFKKVINKYLYILTICLIGIVILSLLETFLTPILFNFITSFK